MENPAGLGSTFGTFPSTRQGDLMPMWAKWSALHAKAQLTSRGSGELFTHFPIPRGKNNHITTDTSDNWNMTLLPNTKSSLKISRRQSHTFKFFSGIKKSGSINISWQSQETDSTVSNIVLCIRDKILQRTLMSVSNRLLCTTKWCSAVFRGYSKATHPEGHLQTSGASQQCQHSSRRLCQLQRGVGFNRKQT